MMNNVADRTVDRRSYQERDRELIDYQLWPLDGTSHVLRGPRPASLDPGTYFAALGAAQTFGRFCADPYPTALGRLLNVSPLNLGFGGAGPEFFMGRPKLIQYVNRSRFAIVLVLSGRSVNNSVFAIKGHGGMVCRRSDPQAPSLDAERAYKLWLSEVDESEAWALLEETRSNWRNAMIRLLDAITVPKILFWFSVRNPNYTPNFSNVQAYFGSFPQFIDERLITGLCGHYDAYVECVSARGLPQPLRSSITGERIEILRGDSRQNTNKYYPSPEMHEDAVASLLPLCKRFV